MALLVAISGSADEGARGRDVTLVASSPELRDALAENGWIRWLGERSGARIEIPLFGDPGPRASTETGDGVVVEVGVGAGPEAWPSGLPLRQDATSVTLGARRHEDADLGVVTRLPPPEPERWRVRAPDRDAAVRLAARVLVRLVGTGSERWDVLVRSPEGLEHRASYRPGAGVGTWEVDPASSHDELALRDRHYASMETLDLGPLRVRAEGRVLGSDLREALTKVAADIPEQAARFPIALEELEIRPVEVVVESDHETHGRYQGVLGPSLDAAGRLHWVADLADLERLRFGLARALVARLPDAPRSPGLDDGGALWLAGGAHGHDVDDWERLLLATGTSVDADRLAARKADVATSPIFRAATEAMLLERAGPGTLRERRSRLEAGGRAAAVAALRASGSGARAEDGRGEERPLVLGPRLPLHGVSLAMHNGLETGYHSRALEDRLDRLGRLGVDAVSIMPFAYQPRANRPELRFASRRPTSETDTGAVHAARRARARGFVVLWKPHLWISHESWPGDVAMTSEADWTAWWASYRGYVLHQAVLAEAAGAEIFSLGVELGRTLERRDEWARLIADTRRIFSGALTYAGNWHDDWELFPYWERLDFVGIDAYFPLGAPDATEADLRRTAAELAAGWEREARRLGRPILLTEVGFSARPSAWVDPHREGGEVDEAAQATAWRALLDGLGKPPWLAGIFAWKVFSADLGPPTDPDFRILDRPAERELERWFRTETKP